MKALVLNGEGKGEDLQGYQDLVEEIFHDNGIETESIKIRDNNLKYCIGCFHCWIGTPGECIHKDSGNDIARKFINSNIAVFLTPLTFGGYSPDLKIAVDRFIPLILPFFRSVDGETHHSMRYDRGPDLIGIGITDRNDPDEEDIFSTLLERNAINLGSRRTDHLVIRKGLDNVSISNRISEILRRSGVVG